MTTPAPAPVPGQPAPVEKWNVLSIVAFVLSFFGGSIISIVLGFIGLSQVKKTGERGRGFAIAAIIIGFVALAFFIIWVIVIVAVVASNPELTTTY